MPKFSKRSCAYCAGRGKVADMGILPTWKTCLACDGFGYVYIPGSFVKCPDCAGTGRRSTGARELVRCKRCRGTGWSEPTFAHNRV